MNLTKEELEIIREDKVLLGLDDQGMIVDLMFYYPEENKLQSISDKYVKLMSVHQYAMQKYVIEAVKKHLEKTYK